MKFVRAGVTKDDHKSGEKAASKIRGPVRKMESEADRTVKDQIFCHVGGFPHRETHEFDEVGILRRIPAEKADFVPISRISRLTESLISVDSTAGFEENQKIAAATKSAGSQASRRR